MKKPVSSLPDQMKALSDRYMFESRLAVMEKFAFETNPIQVLRNEYEVCEDSSGGSESDLTRQEERIKEWSRKPYSNPRVNRRLSLPRISVDEVDQELECLSTDSSLTNVSNHSVTNVSNSPLTNVPICNSSVTDVPSFDLSVSNSSESFEQDTCDLNTWLCDQESADYLTNQSADYLTNQSAGYLDWSSSQSFVPFSSTAIEE